MKHNNIFFLLIATLLFTGCTAKTKGFIEDLYSETETRAAQNQDYAKNYEKPKQVTPTTVKKVVHDESLETRTTLNNNYISDASNLYHGRGKIIDASFDKDVDLYIYAFLQNGTSDPITFYYNKDLRPIGNIVSISVKDNFLINISQENSNRTNQKRKKSDIKTPIVEKINTL